MCANTRHAGSGAFLSVFPFRSSTFAAAYCLSKSVSIRGFPTVSTARFSRIAERSRATSAATACSARRADNERPCLKAGFSNSLQGWLQHPLFRQDTAPCEQVAPISAGPSGRIQMRLLQQERDNPDEFESTSF